MVRDVYTINKIPDFNIGHSIGTLWFAYPLAGLNSA